MTQTRTIRFTNIGKNQLSKLNKNVPVISIRDKYSNFVDIPNEKNREVLRLTFFAGDHMVTTPENLFSKNDALCVLAFISKQLDAGEEQIYIQCGEGRIRSYTLVNEICYSDLSDIFGEDVRFKMDTSESNFKRGVIDRVTARNFSNYAEEVGELFKQVGDFAKIVLVEEENKPENTDE